jgi:hypothetical protein
MHRTLPLVASFGLAACVVACNQYAYVPTTNSSATVAGRPAADYQIPAGNPTGEVRLATFGIASIHPSGTPEKFQVKSLHLRMIVVNNGERPWAVDTREQQAQLAGDGLSRAAYASADRTGSGPPYVQVDPGGKRTIDLFFPLPQRLQKASKLPEFDAIWVVHTATRTVEQRTSFDRLTLDPYYYDEGYGPGFYGNYWYNPWYPYGAFYGTYWGPEWTHPGVVIHR